MTVRILMLGAILSTSPLAAQLLDSIGHFLHQPVRLNVIVDARGSFINNRSARIMGVKIGLEHTDRVRYGLGYNFLLSPVERDITVHEDGMTREVASRLRFGYVAPYFSYTFFVKRRWAVSIPVQVGVGRGSIVYEGLDGRPEVHQRTGVIVYEPAMKVQYRFWRYTAAQFGLGYRLVLRTRSGLGTELTAPVYILGLRFFFRQALEDLDR